MLFINAYCSCSLFQYWAGKHPGPATTQKGQTHQSAPELITASVLFKNRNK